MSRKHRKPTPAKVAKRKRRILSIANAVLTGGPVGFAKKEALRLIDKNKKKLQKFVVDKGGIVPSDNPEELAMQTAQVREQEIQKIVDDPTNDANTIEEASDVWEEGQQEELDTESFEGEADAFTEEALGAVIGVAKGVVKKIKERRAKKGKKSGLLDKLSKAKVDTTGRGSVEVSGITNEGSKDPLSSAIRDAKAGTIDTTIKQYLPIIIIAVVVLFFVMKKK
jgi:hypothetical protein